MAEETNNASMCEINRFILTIQPKGKKNEKTRYLQEENKKGTNGVPNQRVRWSTIAEYHRRYSNFRGGGVGEGYFGKEIEVCGFAVVW